MEIGLTIKFVKGYIAHPYWPAREKFITIQTESGINRVRSEDKRVKALDAYLRAKGLSMDYYKALEVSASRSFYTYADVGLNGGNPAEIVVPAHQLHGFLAESADLCPSAIRLARKEQIRTVASFSDLRTGKTAADGVWDRFVKVMLAMGAKGSNKRALRSNDFLGPGTEATGTLTLADDGQAKRAKDFMEWGGREVGVGASRKLGWGRFTVEKFLAG